MQPAPMIRIRTYILHPDPEVGHHIAWELDRDPRIDVIGMSTDPERAVQISNRLLPDVIVADVEAGAMGLFNSFLAPNIPKVVFLAPKTKSGCDCCYLALQHGAHAIHCRPADGRGPCPYHTLRQSVLAHKPCRPDYCPAVIRFLRTTEQQSTQAVG